MKISHQDVLHIAALARLRLAPPEVERFTVQLNTILEHMEVLRTVDAAGAEAVGGAAEWAAPLRDDDGRITVPGFYDDVRPLTPAEREALAALPPVEEALLEELAIGAPEGPGRLLERTMSPALNVDGLLAGAVGAAARNAIPTEATAALDLRLVPDQRPERVRALVEEHLRAQGYHVVHADPPAETLRAHARVVRVTWEEGYAAHRTPLELPVSRAVVASLEEALGRRVHRVPMLGGSLPLATFHEALGAPLLIVLIVNHDNNQHAPNENLRLENLWDGILAYAGLLARLDAHWRRLEPAPARRAGARPFFTRAALVPFHPWQANAGMIGRERRRTG